MRLVLLGAGASYGASRYGSCRPPLVTGILPSAVELGLFSPTFATKQHEAVLARLRAAGANGEMLERFAAASEQHLFVLTSFIEQQFGVLPDSYGTASLDFERLLALTESELLGYHALLRFARQTPRAARPPDVLDLQIKLVLCGTLIAATRDLRCDFHDVLARWLQPGDMVVSFNYDLLMDRSLSATGGWFQDDGYAIAFAKHGRRNSDEIVWRDGRNTKSSITLLKPHGSLNWLYPRSSWDSVMNMSLQPSAAVPRPPTDLFCLEDMYPRFEDDYPAYEWWERYDIEHEGATFDLHSLIVPPSIAKPYRSYEHLIGPVWGAFAEAMLTRVEKIVLVGYSLREDDVRTHWLLRKAAREGAQLKEVVLVDPSDAVAERATRIFAPLPIERPARTMSEFAELLVRGSL
jgi:hypothetical protein